MPKKCWPLLMLLCIMIAMPQAVIAQGANETWLTVNMSGMNTSLLTIGMQGVDYSRQIIKTDILSVIPLCYTLAPGNLMATEAGPSSIRLTWTVSGCANGTVIRGSQDGWPSSPTDGFLVYSGNGTTTVMDGFAYDLSSCYFRGWTYNDNGYSVNYISLRVGHPIGAPAVVFVIGILGLALWKRNWIRLLLAICLVIWGAFALGYDVKIAAPLITIGSVLFFMAILNMKDMGLTET
jgi:NADH:ubiquinone oxidoreductase subunit K